MLVYGFMTFARFSSLWHSPAFNPQDDTGLFWTESAFHYRYARFYAAGRALPDPDRRIQYPEGIRPLLDETPVMERVAGWAYRTLGFGIPLHVFVLGLACLYSGLTLFAAWFLARFLWGGAAAALAAVLFYATTFSYIGVVPLGDYVRQDFALPCIFTGSALWLWSWKPGRRAAAVLAVPLLVTALMAWHLTRFYLLVMTAVGWISYLLAGEEARKRIGVSNVIITAGCLIAAAGFARLRYTALWASPACLLLAAAGLHYWLLGRRKVSRRSFFLAAAALISSALAAGVFLNAGAPGRYAHVYRLLLSKLRWGGRLPPDPALLDFDSRAMWSSSFTSPGLEEALLFMGVAWLVGAVGAVWLVCRRGRDPVGLSVGLLAAVFAVAFALIRRMDVFLAFFLSVAAGIMLSPPVCRRPHRAMLGLAVFLVLMALNTYRLTRFYIVSAKPVPRTVAPLYRTISSLTGPDEVIFAVFQISPAICLYCDRPVVIHSKFENTTVRRKVREFYEALFLPEEKLYAVCRRYDVGWVVYQPDILLSRGPGSVRYMAAAREVPVNSAACLMHFFPARLRHFVLVYQDGRHRLFKVVQDPSAEPRRRFPLLPVYDASHFNPAALGVVSGIRP